MGQETTNAQQEHPQDGSFGRRAMNFAAGAFAGVTAGLSDKIVGVAAGIKETVAHGGPLGGNIRGAIAKEEALTAQAQAAGGEYAAGQVVGAAVGLVAGGAALAAAKAALITAEGVGATTVAVARASKAVNDMHGAVASADSGLAHLGGMAAPATPKVASAGRGQGAGIG